jgi:serine/threonine-protein kinase
MSTVWAARHELLERDFAIKIAKISPPSETSTREHFLREARIVSRLHHPNIVAIVDAGNLDGRSEVYLAMELLYGQSLASRIAARAPLPAAEVIAIVSEVCRGLSAAHAAGVIHRDIKPENIFLARMPSGGVVPKLLDFGVSSARGIATLGHARSIGTPAYMSPEQALGRTTDHRADVWALGVAMYEMLTGRLPFSAENYLALLPKIIESPIPPLPSSVAEEVRVVVQRCLQKDPGLRCSSADELFEALTQARAALPEAEALSASWSGFFVETSQTLAREPGASAGQAGAYRHSSGTTLLRWGIAPFAVSAAMFAMRGSPQPEREGGDAGAPVAGLALPPVRSAEVGPLPPAGATPPGATALSTTASSLSATARSTVQARGRSPSAASASLSAGSTPHRGKPVTRVDSAGF